MSSPNTSDTEQQAAARSADPTLSANRRTAKHTAHSVRNFEQLIKKVEQAEDALEASERAVAADWRQLHATWRAGWTPVRILVAGVTGGFLFGRLQPGRVLANGGGFLRMLSTVSSLIAGVNAQMAASEAEHAAESAEDVASAAAASARATSSAAEASRR
ncbi:hypothetical protein ACFFGH_02215 [Lysobacter korlensis]|uniref:Protein sip-5 n=1 Tax=Lysobacter korlensis TaxID=553636 RepID=A0ABV6RI53_9GAMM